MTVFESTFHLLGDIYVQVREGWEDMYENTQPSSETPPAFRIRHPFAGRWYGREGKETDDLVGSVLGLG